MQGSEDPGHWAGLPWAWNLGWQGKIGRLARVGHRGGGGHAHPGRHPGKGRRMQNMQNCGLRIAATVVDANFADAEWQVRCPFSSYAGLGWTLFDLTSMWALHAGQRDPRADHCWGTPELWPVERLCVSQSRWGGTLTQVLATKRWWVCMELYSWHSLIPVCWAQVVSGIAQRWYRSGGWSCFQHYFPKNDLTLWQAAFLQL